MIRGLINIRDSVMRMIERLVAINIGLCLDSAIAVAEASYTINWGAF